MFGVLDLSNTIIQLSNTAGIRKSFSIRNGSNQYVDNGPGRPVVYFTVNHRAAVIRSGPVILSKVDDGPAGPLSTLPAARNIFEKLDFERPRQERIALIWIKNKS